MKPLRKSIKRLIEDACDCGCGDVDSDPEDSKIANDAAFKPEKLEDDLPVEKVIKRGNRLNSKTLRLEYFRDLINKTKELNEEI